MKILVSGATGFVGKHLLIRLIKKGYDCAVLVRNPEKAHTLYNCNVKTIEYRKDCFGYVKDIRDFNPEVVIHLAGYLTSADDRETIRKLLEANIEFTTNICSALEKTQAHLFVNTGSFSEYYYGDGNLEPAYFYSATKTAARHLIEYFSKKNDWHVIHVIPYTIYGPGGAGKKVIDYLVESTIFGKYVAMTNGEQVLDFIYIDDIVDFYCMLIEKQDLINAHISEYHIGTGRGTSIRELAETIEEVSGKKANVGWGKRVYRPRDIFHSIAPIARAKQNLGWEPKITLREGVKILIDSLSQDQHE